MKKGNLGERRGRSDGSVGIFAKSMYHGPGRAILFLDYRKYIFFIFSLYNYKH